MLDGKLSKNDPAGGMVPGFEGFGLIRIGGGVGVDPAFGPIWIGELMLPGGLVRSRFDGLAISGDWLKE